MSELVGVEEPGLRSPALRVELPEATAADLAEARRYTMVFAWSPEDAAWIASFPEFPGIRTHGETVEEAAAMAEDAIALAIAVERFERRPVPLPPRTARRFIAAAPAGLEAEEIRALREAAGVSQQLLAAALNVSDSAVQSWEQGRKRPDGAALRLLEVFRRHPGVLEELIQEKPSVADPS